MKGRVKNKNIKPFIKLNKTGLLVFNELVNHLDGKLENIDGLKLTALAHQFQIYAQASLKMDKGFTNKHDQINPAVSALEKSLNLIIKLSAGFGIDPATREKIQAFTNTKEDEPNFN